MRRVKEGRTLIDSEVAELDLAQGVAEDIRRFYVCSFI